MHKAQINEGERDLETMVSFLNLQHLRGTRMVILQRYAFFPRSKKPMAVQNCHSIKLTQPNWASRGIPGWGIPGILNLEVFLRLTYTHSTLIKRILIFIFNWIPLSETHPDKYINIYDLWKNLFSVKTFFFENFSSLLNFHYFFLFFK